MPHNSAPRAGGHRPGPGPALLTAHWGTRNSSALGGVGRQRPPRQAAMPLAALEEGIEGLVALLQASQDHPSLLPHSPKIREFWLFLLRPPMGKRCGDSRADVITSVHRQNTARLHSGTPRVRQSPKCWPHLVIPLDYQQWLRTPKTPCSPQAQSQGV